MRTYQKSRAKKENSKTQPPDHAIGAPVKGRRMYLVRLQTELMLGFEVHI